MSAQSPRPIAVLIAALGGEGGGVLTQWIVNAAAGLGYPVQSTSIPGVAQRTGATTYYIEILPLRASELGGRQPVLSLAPGVGDIDLAVASELLEAGRTIANGYVTPDRTLMIASTSRSYIVTEKMAMGDGRFDAERLAKAVAQHARASLLFDMEAAAKASGAMINAVMLGAIAGCGQLPIPPEAFEAAIREDGKAVESNLRGFRAGLDAARRASASPVAAAPAKRRRGAHSLASLEQEVTAFPVVARDIVAEGVRRLVAYQGIAYAGLYLERLRRLERADAQGGAEGRLLRETARQLAVRMSYEDVIRVAQAKIDPERMCRIEASMAVPGAVLIVTEFLKPGIEEMCSLLPPGLARRVLAAAERRGWRDRFHWGMEVKTTSLNGYLRFWLLAKLRRWRPKTFRYAEEQAQIEEWLALVIEAAHVSSAVALEVVECARLIKGYGDTYRRGLANYRTIEAKVIRPAIAGAYTPEITADAIASARAAALYDPEGEALTRCLAEIRQRPAMAIAAE